IWKMSFCKSDQKSMPMVGFLTRNDSDILRAKTGPYRRIGYQTNIPPTPVRTDPVVPAEIALGSKWMSAVLANMNYQARISFHRIPMEGIRHMFFACMSMEVLH